MRKKPILLKSMRLECRQNSGPEGNSHHRGTNAIHATLWPGQDCYRGADRCSNCNADRGCYTGADELIGSRWEGRRGASGGGSCAHNEALTDKHRGREGRRVGETGKMWGKCQNPVTKRININIEVNLSCKAWESVKTWISQKGHQFLLTTISTRK